MTTVASRTELYAEVQQFYAEQMQRLDNRDIPGYADTFTEDAEFEHSPGIPPARTRAGIIADLVEFHKRFETDPMQRRHWFNMINLQPQDDGTIVSTTYCLVVKIRPNSKPEIAPSCVVHDVLVRVDGALLTRSRRVVHD
ncbi:actinorhodin biosynthesis protein ActVIA [Nocardia amikacinitolerans]|uniref:Actinorhodin biosynthesis protein ActVIA n=1 Tax=Nocardia amikacinitolerans TaxID=756689 RepID=A0A285L4B5_9NOCA|nr:nuclear transport factor 2 family protein [Nocardia amikacinitolerans]MCP2279396.1 actinorhodin biosynthesis protein ActVIA [Nocardia amikacinitolerans]MCP2296807.1 actinorhodin biosynthesis protein ActVIA [Nocardia amikacinitolerans]SNY78486.1 actinorhodin biosynthesis protein ActVIA [Nocardia amikacinitolerans]